jgi:hypothetical protein
MCRMQRHSLALLGLLAVPALGAAARAETLHVPADYPGIRQALNAAHDGDEIVVADGVYTGGRNKNLDFHGKQIVLRSENGPDHCTIDCEGAGRAFFFHSGEGHDSVVEGVTLSNGFMAQGGAVLCIGSSPTLRNCILSNNTAHPAKHSGGGGMANLDGSSPLVEGCSFVGNRQFQLTGHENGGGGMMNVNASNPTVTDCEFSDNRAFEGGALLSAFDSAAVLKRCTFTHNTADETGGGIFTVVDCDSVLIDCSFVENHAGNKGGGFANHQGDPMLINCSFVGNSVGATDWYGGAAGLGSSFHSNALLINCLFSGNEGGGGEGGAFGGAGPDNHVTFVNCTLTENSSTGGGGLCATSGTDVVLVNCVLWNNTAWYGSQVALVLAGLPSSPTSVTVSKSVVQGGEDETYKEDSGFDLNWEAGNLEDDPLFVDPEGLNLSLAAGSPCIDVGDTAALPPDTFDLDGDGDVTEPIPFDLAGAPRISGSPPVVDMGAYEFPSR